MNQGDRIRAMNNDELADFLHNIDSYVCNSCERISMAFPNDDFYEFEDNWDSIKHFLDSKYVAKGDSE